MMRDRLVRKKKKGTASRVIADTLRASTRQVQRFWNWFRYLDIGQILYMSRLSGKTSKWRFWTDADKNE